MDPWAVLTEVFGQLPWQRQPPQRYVGEDYRTELQYRGTLISIRRHSYRPRTIRGGRDMFGWRWSCGLLMTYAPRPLALSLSPSRIGWPRLGTGDATFEKHFRLAGAPPDILRRAFDAELRSRLLSAPLRPHVYGEDGVFELDVGEIVEDGRGGAHELRAMADAFVAVTQRVCGEFDREHADVTSNHGPGAAATWWSQQASALANAQSGRRTLKVLIVAGFLVGAFLLCAIILVIAILL